MTRLAAAYRAAARTTRRRAANFYIAFLTLPRKQRRAVYALYAFFRSLDDAADDVADAVPTALQPSQPRERATGALLQSQSTQCCGALEERREAIDEVRCRFRAVAAGSPASERDLALADAIERFGIDPSDIEDVIAGVEMDLEPVEMETMDDLERYAYLVASAVGLATLAILTDGIPPTDAMRERAIRLGLGMQLVNVVRDVGEDAAQGRVYIPREVLAAHGADRKEIEGSDISEPLRDALRDVAERAREHLRAGRELIPCVPRRSRACLWLLAEVYGRILTRIEASRYDVFSSRVSLSGREKLWLLATAPWRV